MSEYIATFKYHIGGGEVAVSFYNDNEGNQHYYKCICPQREDIAPFELRMNHETNCLCFSDNAPDEIKEYAQQIEDALFEYDAAGSKADPFYPGKSLKDILELWNNKTD